MGLKPCPFCGHEAKLIYDKNRNCVDIYCTNCDCAMTGFYVYFRFHDCAYEDAVNAAVSRWNRREYE